jgi:hypothetical protein
MQVPPPSDGCIYYGGLFIAVFAGVIVGLYILGYIGVFPVV